MKQPHAMPGFLLLGALACSTGILMAAPDKARLVFATFAETPQQLQNVAFFVESVRTFAGAMKDAGILVYVPAPLLAGEPALLRNLEALRAELKLSTAPDWERN